MSSSTPPAHIGALAQASWADACEEETSDKGHFVEIPASEEEAKAAAYSASEGTEALGHDEAPPMNGSQRAAAIALARLASTTVRGPFSGASQAPRPQLVVSPGSDESSGGQGSTFRGPADHLGTVLEIGGPIIDELVEAKALSRSQGFAATLSLGMQTSTALDVIIDAAEDYGGKDFDNRLRQLITHHMRYRMASSSNNAAVSVPAASVEISSAGISAAVPTAAVPTAAVSLTASYEAANAFLDKTWGKMLDTTSERYAIRAYLGKDKCIVNDALSAACFQIIFRHLLTKVEEHQPHLKIAKGYAILLHDSTVSHVVTNGYCPKDSEGSAITDPLQWTPEHIMEILDKAYLRTGVSMGAIVAAFGLRITMTSDEQKRSTFVSIRHLRFFEKYIDKNFAATGEESAKLARLVKMVVEALIKDKAHGNPEGLQASMKVIMESNMKTFESIVERKATLKDVFDMLEVRIIDQMKIEDVKIVDSHIISSLEDCLVPLTNAHTSCIAKSALLKAWRPPSWNSRENGTIEIATLEAHPNARSARSLGSGDGEKRGSGGGSGSYREGGGGHARGGGGAREHESGGGYARGGGGAREHESGGGYARGGGGAREHGSSGFSAAAGGGADPKRETANELLNRIRPFLPPRIEKARLETYMQSARPNQMGGWSRFSFCNPMGGPCEGVTKNPGANKCYHAFHMWENKAYFTKGKSLEGAKAGKALTFGTPETLNDLEHLKEQKSSVTYADATRGQLASRPRV